MVELNYAAIVSGVEWVCDLCKAKKTSCVKEEDHVFTYQCCLLFSGLKDLAYRDIVRENDGIGMVETWRMDMPQFWQNGPNRYLIIGHNFLLGTESIFSIILLNTSELQQCGNVRSALLRIKVPREFDC